MVEPLLRLRLSAEDVEAACCALLASGNYPGAMRVATAAHGTDEDEVADWLGKLAAFDASPPAPGGVPIRIAVAMTPAGDWVAGGRYGWTDEGAWQHCPSGNRWHRAAIITATLSPPVVAEIAGNVEKP